MDLTKHCPGCRADVPLSGFYPQKKGGTQTLCKRCHNQACRQRVKEKADYRERQRLAKRRWEAANPKRKRLHEGRTVLFAGGLAGEIEEMVRTLKRACRAA